jgi:serine/threonine-protein kinase
MTSTPSSLGPYRLVGRLGAGGMAEVWKAEVTGPGGFSRTVVVKRVLPHLADDARFADRFLSEARLSARLHHSNIVDVFACGELDGRHYLAMEFVHGHDLACLLRAHAKEGAPHSGLAAYVMREVCRALGYAHQLTGEDGEPLGVVHRDVSPSNVMVSYDGAVKLLDFGIAKALSELANEHTRQHGLEGKGSYLAPEVTEGHPTNARSDQYAAGIVMHEVLTGSRLFAPGQLRHDYSAIPPPSRRNPRVTPELDRICMRALSIDPAQRFASCDEMAEALDRAAHQLAWGSQQVAALLRYLLPERRYAPVEEKTESVALPVLSLEQQTIIPVELPTTPYEAPMRSPRRVLWAGMLAAIALAGALAWLVARVGSAVDEERVGGVTAGHAPLATPLPTSPPPGRPPPHPPSKATALPATVAPPLQRGPALSTATSPRAKATSLTSPSRAAAATADGRAPAQRSHGNGVRRATAHEDLLNGGMLDPFRSRSNGAFPPVAQ